MTRKLLIASLLLGVAGMAHARTPPSTVAGSNRALPAEARAQALVAAMTREEKLAIIHGYFPPLAKPAEPIAMIPSAGHIPGIPRLGIPTLRESDASLGVANQVEQRKGDTATALPASLATAATFNPALAYAGGAMIGAEARAKSFNILLAGGVNLTRDPWNGRNFEYLGEDPLLAGVMAGEHIRGVQSNHIVSTIKHFALNSQETGRTVLDARIGKAALRESDLLAFQIATEIGDPASVMCAYNKVNGDYACENDWLLNSVLKQDWGYKGWVMSDWGAVHSTEKAALAGLDQESGQELDDAIYFGQPFADALAAGRIPAGRLDDMVRRILYGVIASGLMDDPVPESPRQIDYATHADIAQRAAEEGIVLLKNEGDLLPLAKSARRIVLIGGHADVGVLSGGGSSQVRSVGGAPVEIPLTKGAAASFARMTWHASSPLNAIRALAPQAEVSYVDGSDPRAAAEAARRADLAIVFGWQWQTEAQDPETMRLPGNQDALIDAVATANRRTIVVLETGGPVEMPWIARVPALVQAWYPGQRGGEAIANILFGDVAPSGRLPITFPVRADQAPRPEPAGLAELHAAEARRDAGDKTNYGMTGGVAPFAVDYPEGAEVGYRWYAMKGMKPLFPFGHGLTYTRFAYANLQVQDGAALTVSFDVTNAGSRAGADVPQLYVQARGSAGIAAWRLAGFDKLSLSPGETRRVTMTVDPRLIARFEEVKGWRLDGGDYALAVGHHAGDATLKGVAKLDAMSLKP
ncbi:beta-glucosidase [Sphingobium indicum IP26]|uniref:Beta-glucosidase n=1 Tax=Sphingobium indicum F2 TaxID=1450518 RepID=A0A8E0WRB0_9SPHN|nr:MULTISPECIES: glycoside hydrolase family 3 protein [Sphingobium]EPR15052.1 beta-glucosidase [Sphingobium indicum IP26]EQB05799.1 beta-glucosidase [Sphingobium sp. HDIP04]KER35775.1 beta-glucosidase [Sphingobium indicum F2]